MKNYPELFAANLRRLRKDRGMTQRELADALGYSEKTVSKWENAAAIPEIGALFEIASTLRTDVEQLFSDSEDLYLGIDGGGTKTALALADSSGRIISTLRTDCCNPIDIGLGRSKEVLSDAIYTICRGVRLSQVTMFAGIAGGTSGGMKEALREFFGGFGFRRFGNDSDNLNIISAGLGKGDGISVILGTGICVWSRYKGESRRVAGWGYLIDDGGSAYNIGRDALGAFFRAHDGSGAESPLTRRIAETCTSPEELLKKVYDEGKKTIAGFSPLVFEAAEAGDSLAESILDRNLAFAAGLIKTAAKRFPESGHVKVVLAGGLTEQPSLTDRLTKALSDERFELNILGCEPVEGAVKLAMELGGTQ